MIDENDPLFDLPEDQWPEEMQERAKRIRILIGESQWNAQTQLTIAQAKYGKDLFDAGALLWRLPMAELDRQVDRVARKAQDEMLRGEYNILKAQNEQLHYIHNSTKRRARDFADARDSGSRPDAFGESISPQFVGPITGFIEFAKWSLPLLGELGYKPTTDGANPSEWKYRLIRKDFNQGYTVENLEWQEARRIYRK